MLQSDDRFKHYSWCIRWIQKYPQFQNNLLNSFDLEKFLHQSSFLGLVPIGPVLHCTQNVWLPDSLPTKIWILSPNETVSVSLSDTFIKVLLLAVWISYWPKLHFSMRDRELELLFDFVSSLFFFLVRFWCWRILEHSFRWWVHIILLMNVIWLFFLFLVSYRYWRNPRFPATWWLVNSKLLQTLLESFSFTLFSFHRCFSHHDSTR